MSTYDGLNGKVAIITGGADSIGAAVVKAMHAAGVKTVIAARSEDKGNALARSLQSDALYVRTDLTRQDDVKALVRATADTFDGIDFIVNVACVYADSGCNSSQQEWLDSFNVNVVGGALLVSEAIPFLKQSSGAAVVNFGSISANVAQANRWTYPATKAAIEQLSRSQALDLAAFGIRVNTLRAGVTWSVPVAALSGNNRALADRVTANYQPLGRLADAEEVAEAVLFLCSENASFITGASLPVDGGYGCLGPEASLSIMEVMAKTVAQEQ